MSYPSGIKLEISNRKKHKNYVDIWKLIHSWMTIRSLKKYFSSIEGMKTAKNQMKIKRTSRTFEEHKGSSTRKA